MTREEIIERFCKLSSEVWNALIEPLHSNDCFCGKGGFWGGKSYSDADFRNEGHALEWIESVVRRELQGSHPTPKPVHATVAPTDPMAQCRAEFEAWFLVEFEAFVSGYGRRAIFERFELTEGYRCREVDAAWKGFKAAYKPTPSVEALRRAREALVGVHIESNRLQSYMESAKTKLDAIIKQMESV